MCGIWLRCITVCVSGDSSDAGTRLHLQLTHSLSSPVNRHTSSQHDLRSQNDVTVDMYRHRHPIDVQRTAPCGCHSCPSVRSEASHSSAVRGPHPQIVAPTLLTASGLTTGLLVYGPAGTGTQSPFKFGTESELAAAAGALARGKAQCAPRPVWGAVRRAGGVPQPARYQLARALP